MSKYYAIFGDFTVIEGNDMRSAMSQLPLGEIATVIVGDRIPGIDLPGLLWNSNVIDAEEEVNVVNHPPHYNQGGIECIDAMQACSDDLEFRGFLRLSAQKYLWRMYDKGSPLENLNKAIWYLERLRKMLEK